MKRNRAIALAWDTAAVLLVLAAPYLADWMMSYIPPCPFARWGMVCPACGGTRCVAALAQGELAAAWHHHAYFVLTFVYGAILLVVYNVGAFGGLKWAKRTASCMADWRMVIAWAVGFVIFGLIRIVWG